MCYFYREQIKKWAEVKEALREAIEKAREIMRFYQENNGLERILEEIETIETTDHE